MFTPQSHQLLRVETSALAKRRENDRLGIGLSLSGTFRSRKDYLNSVPYLLAISLICAQVEVFGRNSGRGAGLAEEAIQSRRRDDPEQKQFLIGVREPVP